jgi:hypothetical protein
LGRGWRAKCNQPAPAVPLLSPLVLDLTDDEGETTESAEGSDPAEVVGQAGAVEGLRGAHGTERKEAEDDDEGDLGGVAHVGYCTSAKNKSRTKFLIRPLRRRLTQFMNRNEKAPGFPGAFTSREGELVGVHPLASDQRHDGTSGILRAHHTLDLAARLLAGHVLAHELRLDVGEVDFGTLARGTGGSRSRFHRSDLQRTLRVLLIPASLHSGEVGFLDTGKPEVVRAVAGVLVHVATVDPLRQEASTLLGAVPATIAAVLAGVGVGHENEADQRVLSQDALRGSAVDGEDGGGEGGEDGVAHAGIIGSGSQMQGLSAV